MMKGREQDGGGKAGDETEIARKDAAEIWDEGMGEES
jgi:hypothetical protein